MKFSRTISNVASEVGSFLESAASTAGELGQQAAKQGKIGWLAAQQGARHAAKVAKQQSKAAAKEAKSAAKFARQQAAEMMPGQRKRRFSPWRLVALLAAAIAGFAVFLKKRCASGPAAPASIEPMAHEHLLPADAETVREQIVDNIAEAAPES